MARAERGSVPSGVWYGEGCPLRSRLGGLESVVSSPSGQKRILAYFEGHRTLLFVPMTKVRGGPFPLASPILQIMGGLVPRFPRDLRPCTCDRR